ncbi:MAG: hypothetical protein KGR26_08015, partial [Cyanobacteria bacterium REEB65]|nr:hypothetical protein [Cyanobacteria bacterium REEB65]
ANSPQAFVGVANGSSSFYHGKLQWHNVPAGSFLESGQRVAEAATANAGNLVATLSLAGGGSRVMQLEPNFHRDYRFAVCLEPDRVLAMFPRASNQRPQFAVELGGQSLESAISSLSGLGFPTYLMPGRRDGTKEVQRRLGGDYGSFQVGSDRVLLLDDRAHRLGPTQLEWLRGQVQEFRQEQVQRVFVCMLVAPVDPRRHYRNGLATRREARRVAYLLREARVAAIFAGSGTRSYTRTWYGLREYLLSDHDGLIVECKKGNLSIRLAVH